MIRLSDSHITAPANPFTCLHVCTSKMSFLQSCASRCTVATVSMFALDAALPHAWARDPSRQLEIAECRCKRCLPILCGVVGTVRAVWQQPASVRHLPVHLLAAIHRILLFVLERRNTLSARQPVPQLFLHVHPWQHPTAQLSVPTAAASTRTTLALRVPCMPSRPTARARWASLVVPCRFPPSLSVSTPLWGLLCTSCADECTPPPHVLPWHTAPGEATRHFHLGRGLFLCFSRFVNNPAYLCASFCCLTLANSGVH